MRRDANAGGAGLARIGGRTAALIAGLPWVGYRAVDHFALGDRLPSPHRDGAIEWLLWWRHAVGGWAAAAVEAAPAADVYHGHDLTGLVAAVRAADARGGKVVYDSHDLYLESGRDAKRPGWAKAIVGRLERRWARRADALVTVNATNAAILGARFGRDDAVVVHNCPPRWTRPDGATDRLRAATGIGAGRARRRLPRPLRRRARDRAAGRGDARARSRGRPPRAARLRPARAGPAVARGGAALRWPDPRPAGRPARRAPRRHRDRRRRGDGRSSRPRSTIGPARRTSSSRASRRACPVVASDFPEMPRDRDGRPGRPARRGVRPGGRGLDRRGDPLDSSTRPTTDRADLRARCRAAAHARWNWETESARLVERYATLASS